VCSSELWTLPLQDVLVTAQTISDAHNPHAPRFKYRPLDEPEDEEDLRSREEEKKFPNVHIGTLLMFGWLFLKHLPQLSFRRSFDFVNEISSEYPCF
jgi:hypothetical protein